MKVEGPGRISSPKTAARTQKTGDGGFSALVSETDQPASASGVMAPAAVAGVEAFLALQAVGEEGSSARSKARRRGNLLLDQLERIRMGLLNGGIEKSALDQLARMVSVQREEVMDPALCALLDEIDLRVQVELAKHAL